MEFFDISKSQTDNFFYICYIAHKILEVEMIKHILLTPEQIKAVSEISEKDYKNANTFKTLNWIPRKITIVSQKTVNKGTPNKINKILKELDD